jgi:hypothetical protein
MRSLNHPTNEMSTVIDRNHRSEVVVVVVLRVLRSLRARLCALAAASSAIAGFFAGSRIAHPATYSCWRELHRVKQATRGLWRQQPELLPAFARVV